MSGIPHDHYEPKADWEKGLAKRLPILGLMYDTLMIPTPKNLNWMWIWGVMLTVFLVIQIVTGITLVKELTDRPPGPEADDDDEDPEKKSPVSLSQRAFPLIELLRRAAEGGHSVTWSKA